MGVLPGQGDQAEHRRVGAGQPAHPARGDAGTHREGRAFIDRKIGDYGEKIRRYEVEKDEIKRKAEGFHEHYELLDARHDQFDMAEALTSIAIALLGITALTQKRRLFYLAWAFAALGIVLGLAGFIGLGLHPDFLARALGSS